MAVDIPDLARKLDELFGIKQREKAEDDKALLDAGNALAKADEASKAELQAKYKALKNSLGQKIYVTSPKQLSLEIPVARSNINYWTDHNRIPANRIPRFEDIFGRELFNKVCGITEAQSNEIAELNKNNPSIFNVPIPHNPFFTGREKVLDELHNALHQSNELVVKPSLKATALSGMGGVGKTTTVAEYAHYYQDDYTAVLWVGDCDKALKNNFGQLAPLLGSKATKLDDQIIYVQSWLRNNNGWLLIFDNAETSEVLGAAKALIPTNAQGYSLYTTRAQATGSINAVELDCFDDATGATLLLRRSKFVDQGVVEHEVRNTVEADDWQTANTLSHELGGLALAIDQAGAYIEQSDCSLQTYLGLLRTRTAELLKIRGTVSNQDHPDSVYVTFALALENARKHFLQGLENPKNPNLVDHILCRAAFLHPDGIPEVLFKKFDLFELNKALAALKDYSLIKRIKEKNMFTVHRLVQVVVKADPAHVVNSRIPS